MFSPAARRGFTRLSGGGGGLTSLPCPAKALLSDLAEATGLPSDLHVYRAYLKCSLNLNLSHDTLASLEDSVLARFYNQEDPSQPPRYLDWTQTRHWGRLELALGVRLVLARPPDAFGRPWMRVHDRRTTDLLLPPSSAAATSSRLTLFYAVVREDNQWVLYKGSAESDFELTRFAESFAVDWERLADTGRISKSSDCYVRKFSDALGRTPWNASAHPTCDENCSTLYEVCSAVTSAAFEATPFTLATHVSTQLTVRRSHQPRHQSYQTLGRFGGGDGGDVLLLRIDGSVVPATKEHARQVLSPESSGCSEHPSHYSHPGVAWKGRRREARKRKWRTDGEPGPHCAACDEEEDYRKNLDPRKGQKLFNYQPSTFHLLEMLGMDSCENVAAVRRAADHSCLYYDVESCTILSKTEAGNEELHLNFRPLTEHGEGRKVLGTQKPVLISFADGIDLHREEGEEEEEPVVLSCEPGEVDDMVARFVDLVVQRRDRATTSKEVTLRPIVSAVAAFKEAYMDFFRSEGVLPPKTSAAAAATSVADHHEDVTLDDFEDSHQQDDRFRRDFGGGAEEEEEEEEKIKRRRKTTKEKRRREKEEEEELDPSIARTVRDVHKGWSSSLWGRLEGNLAALTKSFSAFGFNCEG
jgi:hypothetical protein